MDRSKRAVADALSHDAIVEFEQITGKSYKENTLPENLMMLGLFSERSDEKRVLLEVTGDTTFSMDVDSYINNITRFGFSEVYSEEFNDGERDRLFKVFWFAEHGILLKFDTFWEKVNGGNFYYNWKPHNPDSQKGSTSSGSFTKVGDEYIWVGDHDCREAVRFNITRLLENGEFVVPWVKQPWIWFVLKGENTDDHKQITSERLGRLPSVVKTAIGA